MGGTFEESDSCLAEEEERKIKEQIAKEKEKEEEAIKI